MSTLKYALSLAAALGAASASGNTAAQSKGPDDWSTGQGSANVLQNTASNARQAVAGDVWVPLRSGGVGLVQNEHGTGVKLMGQGEVTIDGHVVTIYADATIVGEFREAFLALGAKVYEGENGREVHASMALTRRRDDAGVLLGDKQYEDKGLTSQKLTLQVDISNLGPFERAHIMAIFGSTNDTLLSQETTTNQTRRIIDTGTTLREMLELAHTTKTTRFDGAVTRALSGGVQKWVGEHTILSARLGIAERSIGDETDTTFTGGVGVEGYYNRFGYKVNLDQLGKDTGVVSVRINAILSENWTGSAGFERQFMPYGTDNTIMAGLTWNPQSRETGLTRPNPAELLSDEVMRKLAFNPNARAYADGETRISQTQVVEERQLSETGKTPIVPANLRATVQRDGSVVLTFDDSNTKQIAGVTYRCSVNGGTPKPCTNGTVFPASDFQIGSNNTITFTATNPAVPNAPVSVSIPVSNITVYSDAATNALVPLLTNATHNTLSVQYRISDANGVNEKTCVLKNSSGTVVATVTPDANGICTFSGLTPNTTYTLVTSGLAVVQHPDGTTETRYTETYTAVNTLQNPDTPGTANISISGANTWEINGVIFTVTGETFNLNLNASDNDGIASYQILVQKNGGTWDVYQSGSGNPPNTSSYTPIGRPDDIFNFKLIITDSGDNTTESTLASITLG